MLQSWESPITSRRPAPPSMFVMLACWLAMLVFLAVEYKRWSSQPQYAKETAKVDSAAPQPIMLSKLSASLVPMPQGVPSAHASSLTAISGDEMLAFWWAGTRESAPDVKVYMARWSKGTWGPAREIVSRDSLGHALGFGIRRIGNPVAWTARDGKINLFVVATGLGGWAASRVAHLESADLGQTFKVKRMLPMSPLFNTSVLVRSSAIGLADGGWLLPAYFELGVKYPLLMAFDDDGDPQWLARIGKRGAALQPAIVPVSATEAHAWMRDASDERRIQQAFSRDGGETWEDLPALDLPNHNTSVAAIRLKQGSYLLLHNHVLEGGSARNVLRLSISQDLRTWRHVFDVARGKAGEEFSYPTLQQVGDELHVTYTSRRTAIAHHVYRIQFQEAPQ